MKSKTRLSVFFEEFFLNILKKFNFFKKKFSITFFFLFLGFISGNFFSSFLNTIRELIIWDGFIIFNLLVFIEIINFFVYGSSKRYFFLFFFKSKCLKKKGFYSCIQGASFMSLLKKTSTNFLKNFTNIKNFFFQFLNFFKIGLILGFFIDAFKVGS
jgi:Protein of unknown function (DUF565)